MNVAYIPPQTTGAVSLGFSIPAETVTHVATGGRDNVLARLGDQLLPTLVLAPDRG